MTAAGNVISLAAERARRQAEVTLIDIIEEVVARRIRKAVRHGS